MLTETALGLVMQHASRALVARCTAPLNVAMQAHGIISLPRVVAFLAQIGHESGELRWMQELWGPTAQQRRYEPVSSLAKALGNTQRGDGKRYRGRGPIQITGRANYARYGALLGLDLEANPDQAATPNVGFQIAALFWQRNGLNELADQVRQASDPAFTTLTRRINGGTNGLAQRRQLWQRAMAALTAQGAWPDPPAIAAPAKRSTSGASRPAPPRQRLARGAEAIAKDAAPPRHAPAAAPPPTAQGVDDT